MAAAPLESVHQLGELVSGSGRGGADSASRKPLPGRAGMRVPAAARTPGTARGEAGRVCRGPAGHRAPGEAAEAPAGEAQPACSWRRRRERGRVPAGTCLRSRHQAADARGHLLATPRVWATSSGRSPFSCRSPGRGVVGGSSILPGVSVSRKPEARGM